MNALRKSALAVLDTIERKLDEEPARLIGYGAAIVVFIVAQVLNARGIWTTDLSFEEAIQATVIAIGFVAVVVESIRSFVYAPQTYIEDLADIYQQGNEEGHEEAHAEEELQRLVQRIREDASAKATPQPPRTAVTVGSTKARNASEKPD